MIFVPELSIWSESVLVHSSPLQFSGSSWPVVVMLHPASFPLGHGTFGAGPATELLIIACSNTSSRHLARNAVVFILITCRLQRHNVIYNGTMRILARPDMIIDYMQSPMHYSHRPTPRSKIAFNKATKRV